MLQRQAPLHLLRTKERLDVCCDSRRPNVLFGRSFRLRQQRRFLCGKDGIALVRAIRKAHPALAADRFGCARVPPVDRSYQRRSSASRSISDWAFWHDQSGAASRATPPRAAKL